MRVLSLGLPQQLTFGAVQDPCRNMPQLGAGVILGCGSIVAAGRVGGAPGRPLRT